MDMLTAAVLGQPLWMWLAFAGLVIALLALDLGILHRDQHEIGVRESLFLSAGYLSLGLAFGGWVWHQLGRESGIEYITGFLIEKSLALDNIFVIATIFAAFAVPRAYQHRVLFWGVLGVIVLRGVMIGFGAALVASFEWMLFIFAAFLVVMGAKMFFADKAPEDPHDNPVYRWLVRHIRVTPELHGSRFFVKQPGRTGKLVWFATPLFMALIMVELADVVFAVDSVPAIFSITTDPYIVYTSNIFAILGLRALYFALAAVVARFAYLKHALAALLVFIGGKVFFAEMMGWEKFPAPVSLAITAALLFAGIGWSLWKTREQGRGL
ncbi:MULTISPECIES: TerC family protein [unclassified Phenylobacterium]|uniref:TerC family protein n=1 Tax=unclassified Phenylobacterium TaxID=2640670 RepID=UPI0022B36104|nr:TerC family protein [Phenylobacterium sp. NIBR 498073]MBS0491915.1 TerC family protein [Pseudomonadota bacterium]WGU41153.1 TerC family protein [Phenylobacterium sp. NIBR 498073]